ncbi:MAG: hypothetical protein RL145_839 [Pseudomonadota bacterium]
MLFSCPRRMAQRQMTVASNLALQLLFADAHVNEGDYVQVAQKCDYFIYDFAGGVDPK